MFDVFVVSVCGVAVVVVFPVVVVVVDADVVIAVIVAGGVTALARCFCSR